MPRNVLLMTATVTPLPGIPSLARTDPKSRLHDYLEALTFYTRLLDSCFDAIVFAENSNSDVSLLVDHVAQSAHFGKVEFISFYGLDYPPPHGRGFGEFRLVDYAIENSKLISPRDVVWKVTGRYIIENIGSIVKSRPPTADLYCHMRNYPYHLCELYLLAWTRRGYEIAIKGIYPKMRNDIIPNTHTVEETSFREVIDQSRGAINVFARFCVVPIIRGMRGWDNSQYSRKWSFKLIARRVALIFVPSLWI
jgi:hypothetical protein